MIDPTERFSTRVDDYVRARPGYPPELLGPLRAAGLLGAGGLVADIGCGPGQLAEVFLRHSAATVVGVEPNRPMREAGRQRLAAFVEAGRFSTTDGRAEATGLAAGVAEVVAAGQAFHWFEPEATRAEFQRILAPHGRVALVWNERRRAATPFLAAYEALLVEFGDDYVRIDRSHIDPAKIAAVLGHDGWAEDRFAYRQDLDLPALRARLLSSSYAPAAGDPRHLPMLAALDAAFAAHAADGTVALLYDTVLIHASLR